MRLLENFLAPPRPPPPFTAIWFFDGVEYGPEYLMLKVLLLAINHALSYKPCTLMLRPYSSAKVGDRVLPRKPPAVAAEGWAYGLNFRTRVKGWYPPDFCV